MRSLTALRHNPRMQPHIFNSTPLLVAKGRIIMKKILLASLLGLSLAAGSVYAEPVHDWRDLDAVHKHVQESIREMERARAKNHYDMDGHGAKAEELLRQSEMELKAAVESARHAK